MTTFPIGTIVHCNRCDKAFSLPRNREGWEFNQPKQRSTRLSEFETCPHCGMTDNHWVYAEDEHLQPNPKQSAQHLNRVEISNQEIKNLAIKIDNLAAQLHGVNESEIRNELYGIADYLSSKVTPST